MPTGLRAKPCLTRRLAAGACALAPLLLGAPSPALAANANAPANATAKAAAAKTAPAPRAPACAWSDWTAFKGALLSADGRVIDASSPRQVTVSEGQSYALFFALVANDRAAFDKILAWTENNLAQGDLAAHLPAWIWGRTDIDENGAPVGASGTSGASSASVASAASATQTPSATWGVIDANSASDADLWIAYTLLEAGRLWNVRRYTAIGTVMARNILRRETASLPGLGRTVLPGPTGFKLDKTSWRLNPSYVPLQVMRRFTLAMPEKEQAAWKSLLGSSAQLVNGTAPKGFSPDWVVYRAQGNKGDFGPDEPTHAESAYNAIRVYLWAGMLAHDDPARSATLATFAPLSAFVAAHGFPPERVNTQTGEPGPNEGNGGFSAAVAPYLSALGRTDLSDAQVERSRARAQKSPPGYYSSVLMLFGLGYLQGLYRFDAQGRVIPAWTAQCPAAR
ncbi:endo-1,4-D-glucanase [Paraburkholderia tropica]|uniref:cellulose synthase complex periplasmic endoglucanase BcsZ n=1 Tax=Paraburkholderia tropica TaxID=92647 RepID=UPI001CAE40DD|nr:cellulose synthase complex periplasmic endoglucanase BcsZ [Paraburkholderia tropica]CAG9234832.1 endo-1,4-D-glucanase [Paraburkholderia tropica]